MNVLTFSGRLGADAEIKSTRLGTTICSFPVALESGWGDNKKTSWPRCNIFGKRAESGLVQYLVKGQQVIISGEVSMETWQGKDGENKTAAKIAVDKIDLIGSKQDSGYSQQTKPEAPSIPQQPNNDWGDVPF